MQRVKYKDGISIIVTLYNKEEYILQTLNSATNQFEESEKYQVIVVDDGSKDRSYKIAKDFLKKKKNRLQNFYSKKYRAKYRDK